MDSSQLQETTAQIIQLLKDAAARGEDLVIPGLGTFEIEHESSEMNRESGGRILMTPPRNQLRFSPKGSASEPPHVAETDAFAEFSRHIREQVSTEGRADIRGLGMFVHYGGALAFEPSDSLIKAINEQYAELESESLRPGATREGDTTTGAPPVVDVPSGAATTEKTVTNLFEDAQKQSDAPAGKAGEGGGAGEEGGGRKGSGVTEGDMPSPASEEENKRSFAPEATAAIASTSDAGSTPEPVPTPPGEAAGEVPPVDGGGSPRSSGKRSRSSLAAWLALGLFLLAGAGYLVWDFTRGTSDTAITEESGRNVMPTSPGILDDTTDQDTSATGAGDGGQAQDPAADGAASEQPQSEQGQTGQAQTGQPPAGDAAADESPADQPAAQGFAPEEGGYSLIVSSTPSRSSAENVLQQYVDQLSDRNIPMGVVEAQVNGASSYRVGVGQYETLNEAQQALSDLSDELPDDAWIVEL